MNNIEEAPETKTQDNRTLLIVAALVVLLLCCCMGGLALYFGFMLSASRSMPIPLFARNTPTPISREEVNSLTDLGKIYFGLDDVDDSCHVIRQTDKFSQEDILRSRYIYFSAPFASKYEGEIVEWSVYDLQGKSIERGQKRPLTLTSELKNCLKGIVIISPRTPPGEYIMNLTYAGKLAYREVFTVTASDLDKIPRPKRKPFGDITFGHRIDGDACIATQASDSYAVTDVKEDPWFYIVSPFQLDDIGKKVYWSVRSPTNASVFGRIERTIDDAIDLCFWQGFSMEDAPAGKYTVIVEDDQSTVLYQKDFELK